MLLKLMLMDFILFVQLIHQSYVNENDGDEKVNGTLLCKPKAEWKACDFDDIHLFFKQYTCPKTDSKPDAQ